MRIMLIEPADETSFAPIALMRPVFELLCGTRSLRQRILETLQPESWGVLIRKSLKDVYQEEFPDAHINDSKWLNEGKTLVIDGRWLGDPRQLRDVWEGTSQVQGTQLIDEADFQNTVLNTLLTSIDFERPVDATQKLNAPWETISRNADMIRLDAALLSDQLQGGQDVSHCLTANSNPDQVFVDPSAKLEPFVSINAEEGPVIVEAGVKIQSFTRLEGPCFIGRETQLFRANIRAETSIGPVCRVGGEIEASIIHGYANKYHDGFLGHSYVCPWVNLGALTSNSDLKNDYSDVKFPLGCEYIQTGEKKIGALIGDHVKTAIGTLFNTGTNVGVMGMVLPAGKLCPKHIPSFTRLWHGQLDSTFDFEAALQTAQTAMGRRKQSLTPAMQKLLETLHSETAQERDFALDNAARKNQ